MARRRVFPGNLRDEIRYQRRAAVEARDHRGFRENRVVLVTRDAPDTVKTDSIELRGITRTKSRPCRTDIGDVGRDDCWQRDESFGLRSNPFSCQIS